MPIINEPSVPGAVGGAAEDVARRATAEERAGNWDAAADLYAATFRSALREGLAERSVDALRGQARMRLSQRRFEEAQELAELAVELAERYGLPYAVARGLNVLGLVRFHWEGDLGQAAALYGRALELALDLGDDELVGLACQNLGVAAHVRGDYREARARYLEGIGSFVRSGSTANAMLAYNNLGQASADLHEWMEAEVYFTRGLEIAERLGHAPSAGMLYGNLAGPLIQVGELERARRALDLAEAAAGQVGDRVSLADAARFRGMMARLEGDLAAADAHLARALEIAAAPELARERGAALRELAELRLAQRRRAEALECLREAARVLEGRGAEAEARGARERLDGLEAQRS
ncbi:MAG TPA: hypothetical protein VF746_02900 [Longimicrobium sp.]|jgi:tetratricopeptide (TPR) repeat protein